MGTVLAALCGGLLIGCGGGSVDIKDLGSAIISAQCDHYVKCGEIASHDICVALLSQGFSADEIVGSVNAGKVKYDGSLAQDCLDAISGESCDPSAEDNRVTPQACIDAIKGTIADAGACANNNECISGSCNPGTNTGTCPAGTCDPTAPAAAKIGAACGTQGTSFIACVDGAYCNTSNQCAALLASGQTCTADNQCAYGTVCSGTGTALTCNKPPQKAGDACIQHNGGADCVITGLYCNGSNACAGYADSGATCSATVPCKFDLNCDGTAMKCGALPDAGGNCPNFSCSPGNYCQTDMTTGNPTTCAALKANGTACTGGNECQSGNCDATSMQCAAITSCI
jgi:hypothetical protein